MCLLCICVVPVVSLLPGRSTQTHEHIQFASGTITKKLWYSRLVSATRLLLYVHCSPSTTHLRLSAAAQALLCPPPIDARLACVAVQATTNTTTMCHHYRPTQSMTTRRWRLLAVMVTAFGDVGWQSMETSLSYRRVPSCNTVRTDIRRKNSRHCSCCLSASFHLWPMLKTV